jgi:hypothetical protein
VTNPCGLTEQEQQFRDPPRLEKAEVVSREALDRVESVAADPPVTRTYSLEPEILERLSNVTELSRSLTPAAL